MTMVKCNVRRGKGLRSEFTSADDRTMTAAGVTVVSHPLVQHKLSLMRDRQTSTAEFRRLLREIALLLGYEVTRHLPIEMRRIETPIQPMDAPFIEGKKLVVVPILRAGLGLAEGLLDLVPSARVGPCRALSRSHDAGGGRVFLQAAGRHRRALGDRHRSHAGDGAFGDRRGAHPEAQRLPPLAVPRACSPRPRASPPSPRRIPTCRSRSPRSTTASTTTPISSPASAMPATGCSARSSPTRYTPPRSSSSRSR